MEDWESGQLLSPVVQKIRSSISDASRKGAINRPQRPFGNSFSSILKKGSQKNLWPLWDANGHFLNSTRLAAGALPCSTTTKRQRPVGMECGP